jgi:hypothetical protein
VASESQDFQNQPFFEGKFKRKPQQQQHKDNKIVPDDIVKVKVQSLAFGEDSD